MKSFAIIAAALVATATPALAQYHNDPHHGYGPQHGPPPRMMVRHRYYEGQNWHGHRLHYANGHWGYYQPRNGVHVFISIPL